MSATPIRIAVFVGSTRKGGNGIGISNWVSSGLSKVVASHPELDVEIVPVHFTSPNYIIGPLIEDVVPAGVKDPAKYGNTAIINWSHFVSSCKGFVIVSPQYNWGYPGELKNALDHLFNEWVGKPLAIVTYGGHGGNKAGEQLRQVTGGGLDMRLVEQKVEITLPRDYIVGTSSVATDASVAATEGKDSWLQPFEKPLEDAMESLLALIVSPPAEDSRKH
ncbi:flavo protein [Dacryopinax primogenitus]|uniref:Flavo protein n=1 Tax=Dacryopinax primogenitus (strain DJM 731) TaxID=1858805 RepID=M5FZ25_DACPD|nr:flavo protein [Dacryopinax primogenitus]EJT96732.1 flavo protein [Dacryopinax primogenitus]